VQEPERDRSPPDSGGRTTRLVAVSNRLPITVERKGGEWRVQPGGGGLVRALAPVLRNRGGLWIGWSGTTEEVDWRELIGEASKDIGYQLHTVTLTSEEVEGFYIGFSNQVIWPLFHDLQTRCNFDPEFWHYYRLVNEKFAEVIGQNSTEADYIWVHDYQLIHVGEIMRSLGIQRRTGFFLHIPFPAPDLFIKLPWRAEILKALLEYDLIGFQTMRDRRHFVNSLLYLMPGVKVSGRGAVQSVEIGDRQVRVGNFPISIDFDSFARQAGSPTVTTQVNWLRRSMMDSYIAFGADRLDYTKGIPERLLAFRNALERYPDLQRRLTLVQVVVPSRIEVAEYRSLKAEVEQLVGEINGRFTHAGWVPIHYLYRNLDTEELLAYYRAARIALVTPLKDGMNLVAKEYCASNVQEDGVLILSEFAGAAYQLQENALLVNPYDIEGMADAIHQAFYMDSEEKRQRMGRMRDTIRRNNIFKWIDSYLQAAFAKQLGDFPSVEEFIPQIRLDIEG